MTSPATESSDADPRPVPAMYEALLERALAEDHVGEDITTAALVPRDKQGEAVVTVKAPGIICGLPLLSAVFERIAEQDGEQVEVSLLAEDGDTIGAGTVVARLRGPAAALLRGERTALNFLQRLSGVATRTHAFVENTMATGVGIYDTRKTTPGWRALEKYAVRCGGGRNHRMHLADAAMIKENHLRAAYDRTGPEATAQGVRALLAAVSEGVTIYVEAESQLELEAAVSAAEGAADRLVVMLDDFAFDDIRRAVTWVRSQPRPHPRLEVTGGVTLDRVEGLCATGVQRLSTGSVTHSAPALDISMKLV